jgi:hypothetical protein
MKITDCSSRRNKGYNVGNTDLECLDRNTMNMTTYYQRK